MLPILQNEFPWFFFISTWIDHYFLIFTILVKECLFFFFFQSHRELDRVGSDVLAHVEFLLVFVLDFRVCTPTNWDAAVYHRGNVGHWFDSALSEGGWGPHSAAIWMVTACNQKNFLYSLSLDIQKSKIRCEQVYTAFHARAQLVVDIVPQLCALHRKRIAWLSVAWRWMKGVCVIEVLGDWMEGYSNISQRNTAQDGTSPRNRDFTDRKLSSSISKAPCSYIESEIKAKASERGFAEDQDDMEESIVFWPSFGRDAVVWGVVCL